MNRVYGNKKDFAPIREEWSRYVVSHSMVDEPDGKHATWCEISFDKNEINGRPTLELIKKAVVADINEDTSERILSSFIWKAKPVWLSDDFQKNISEAQRAGEMCPESFVPMKFKLGEDADGSPVYHEFQNPDELKDFFLAMRAYIQQCLENGWTRKDAIDWNLYK